MNLRAAINTPIQVLHFMFLLFSFSVLGGDADAPNLPQGGAADVVAAAMIKLNNHKRFREIGWVMILQVHDEANPTLFLMPEPTTS